MNVLGHDGNPLGMDRAEIGVLEQSNKVRLRRLLESEDGVALEPEIGLEILSDLSHQPLEWQLPDQKLGALLVLPYLPANFHPNSKNKIRSQHSKVEFMRNQN